MFSYIAKSLVSKTLKTALGKYLEDIELESIDYGGNSEEAGSGWGVSLSSVKLREGMELAKLPGQRKRRCNPANTESDAMSASNKSVRVAPSVVHIDDVEIGAKSLKSCRRHDSADIEGGSISSTPSTPPQSGRGVCGASNIPFCRSGSASRNVVVLDASRHKHLTEMQFLNDKNTRTSAESSQTDLDAKIADKVENGGTGRRSDSESEHSNTEDVAGDGNVSLVVGSGGIIGHLKIGMVGKELSINIEDAHLILEVVVDAKDDSEGLQKSDSSAADDQPRTSSRSYSVSSEADAPSGDSDRSSTGDKIKRKSMLAKCLSSIPHIFLRDCRVSLILPEEESDSKDTCEDCTVFELGIDFLSVTSGDDFLDTLRFGAKEKTPLKKKSQPAFRRSSSVTSESESNMPLRRARSLASENPASSKNVDVVRSTKIQNSYGWKVIRTGKGPEGGVWMKVFPPSYKSKPLRKTEHRWARQRYMDSSAHSTLFSVSAVDLHARLLMNSSSQISQQGDTAFQDEYEDYTLDSMLFGVDYIDPISLTRHQVNKHEEQIRKDQLERISSTRSDEVTKGVDRNGNQMVPFPSNLHRLAKQAHSGQKTMSQEETFDFYEKCVGPTTDIGSMDDYTPLPGFCFCLSVADPIEFNVDRDKLDAIGYLASLFTPSSEDTEKDEIDDEHSEPPIHRQQQPNVGSLDEKIQNDAFPSYMQPDSIFLSGIHLAKVIVRVEIMESTQKSRGLAFSYWQLRLESLHIEDTRVDSSHLQLNDINFHLGGVDWVERKGVCSQSLVIAGLDAARDEGCPKQSESSILCTAARVLGIAVPVSADSRLNSASALQCKLISTRCGHNVSSRISYADVRLGKLVADLSNTLATNIAATVHESMTIISNEDRKTLADANSSQEKTDKTSPEPKSHSMLLSVTTSGGTLYYRPKVRMTVPCSKVRIARGAQGLSIENLRPILLDQFNFGTYYFNRFDSSSTCLGSLPETLRMRILLFLGDLTPLEKALGVKSKRKTSMFIRSHAVNKNLTKRGPKKTSERASLGETSTRRLALLSKLNALDTDSLEGLLAMHDRSKL